MLFGVPVHALDGGLKLGLCEVVVAQRGHQGNARQPTAHRRKTALKAIVARAYQVSATSAETPLRPVLAL